MQKLRNGPIWLPDDEIEKILSPKMAYDAVRDALICHANGDYDQPLKPYVRPGGREREAECGRLITMPCYVGGEVNALGTKLIAGFANNISRGLPRASGVVVLHDAASGVPEAILDCRTLSARRTAAVASICVDHLATCDALRVAIIGAGPISREVVRSLCTLNRSIEQLNLCDLCPDRVANLLEFSQEHSQAPIYASTSAETCIRDSNVIITAVTGTKGYIELDWLEKEGWLMIPMSLDDCQPQVLLGADKFICDDFDQCNREEKLLHKLTMAGQFDPENVYANLGQIVSGTKAGREGNERIYANLMGMAVEDISVAARVFRVATTL